MAACYENDVNDVTAPYVGCIVNSKNQRI